MTKRPRDQRRNRDNHKVKFSKELWAKWLKRLAARAVDEPVHVKAFRNTIEERHPTPKD